MGALRGFILGFLALSIARPLFAESTKHSDTTGGAYEKEGDNGLTDAEIARMNAEQQAMYKRLKDGRFPTSKNGKSRYSTRLEIHDYNGDGITDHDKAANGLEGPMDKIAIGQSSLAGPQRDKLLIEKTDPTKATPPKGGTVPPRNPNSSANNLSPILVDKGSAHGDDKQIHRVYDLVGDAKTAAVKAGQGYADDAIAAAGRETRADGKQVFADPDLLRSEYMYLEKLKDIQVKSQRRGLVADRLAGLEAVQNGVAKNTLAQNKDYVGARPDLELRYLIAGGADDATLAKRIAERDGLGGTMFCKMASGNPQPCQPGEESTEQNDQAIPQNQKPKSLEDYVKTLGSGATDESKRSAAYSAARAGLKNNPDLQKEINENTTKIVGCLKTGAYCYDRRHAQEAVASITNPVDRDKKLKSILFADPTRKDTGDAYEDTREVIYNGLERARAGGLNQWEKNFGGNQDFTANTDAKAKVKTYSGMMQEVNDARQAAQKFQDAERQKDAEVAAMGIKADPSKFLDSSLYDPNTMNVQQLFGRNPNRDAVTTYNKDQAYDANLDRSQGLDETPGGGGSSGPSPASSGSASNGQGPVSNTNNIGGRN